MQTVIIYLVEFLLFVLPLFLILLILIQRGKGGGLAGAFGGMGGQSAFGTKAGDLFTRITIGVAAVWIVLCVFSVWYFRLCGFSWTGPLSVPPRINRSRATRRLPAAPASGSSGPAAPSGPTLPDSPDE